MIKILSLLLLIYLLFKFFSLLFKKFRSDYLNPKKNNNKKKHNNSGEFVDYEELD